MTDETTTTPPSDDGAGFDPGPAFDPGTAPAAGEERGPIEPPKLLTVPEMKRMLLDASKLANEHVGDTTKSNLAMTELEASLIAPGLVRYANARPQVLATFTGADYLKLFVGGGMYATRNVRERRATIAEERAASEATTEFIPLEPLEPIAPVGGER
jgi:hypothetical protein